MKSLVDELLNMSRTEAILLILILVPTLITLIWGAPWIPTPKDRARKMLQLAKLKNGEKIYDLGCGDGRLVHLASMEHGANAVGLEFSPLVYAWAKIIQPFYWLKGSRAQIKFRNFYNVDLSDADVITCYLLPHTMRYVQKKCDRELKPGARLISYAFKVEAWTPAHREKRNRKKGHGPIWVYKMEKARP